MGKLNTRSDEGVFIGTHPLSKAYRVLNKRIGKVMETMNVMVDETSITPTQKEVDQLPKSVLPLVLVSNKVEEDHSFPPTPNVD